MNDSRYILFFLGILGAFNGVILGAYFLFLSRRKSLAHYFLGILLLALSVRIGKSVFVYFNPDLARIYLQVGLSACFLIGPSVYYFVRSSLEQPSKLPVAWKWTLGVLVSLLLIAGFTYPYEAYPHLWNQYFIRIIYAQWLVYMIASIIRVFPIIRRLFSSQARTALLAGEKWLLTIVGINMVIFLTYAGALLIRGAFPLYYSGSVIFSFFFYGVVLFLLFSRQTAVLLNPVAAKAAPAAKKIKEADAATLLDKLEQVMAQQELYSNPALTLGDLAKAVNVSSHQLSAVLNDHAGKNFTSYINSCRIEKACTLIAADHPFSLEAIGYEVGFNSKSTFYTAFKKWKGTTPALYKESLGKKVSV